MFIISYFKSILFVYQLIFLKWFGIRTNKTNKILINHAFGKTYKFPAVAHEDRLVLLKYYIKILLLKVEKHKLLTKGKAIVDVGFASVENRKGFIKCFTGEQIGVHIGLSALRYFPSFFHKISYFILTFPLFLILFSVSLFSKKRVNLAILLEVIVVNENLVNILDKTNTVYFFSIFELESNFYAYSLIKAGVKVIKVAADVPLVYWNQNIIASTLILCNAYQFEEVKEFEATLQVNEFIFWGPEKFHEFKEFYQEAGDEPPINTVGFYSSASWVRREEGDFEAGNLFENEVAICSALNSFLEKNKEVELTIFLHPREKIGVFKEKSLVYYESIFKGRNYKVGAVNLPSVNSFELVDLAVSVGSTLMYERLYCGFKSVFFQEEDGIPIKDSSLSNIWVKNEEAFLEKMNSSLVMSTKDFFKENKINHYCPKYEKADVLSR